MRANYEVSFVVKGNRGESEQDIENWIQELFLGSDVKKLNIKLIERVE